MYQSFANLGDAAISPSSQSMTSHHQDSSLFLAPSHRSPKGNTEMLGRHRKQVQPVTSASSCAVFVHLSHCFAGQKQRQRSLREAFGQPFDSFDAHSQPDFTSSPQARSVRIGTLASPVGIHSLRSPQRKLPPMRWNGDSGRFVSNHRVRSPAIAVIPRSHKLHLYPL
jgi:hypothetical protein